MNKVFMQESRVELPLMTKTAINVFLQEARPFEGGGVTIKMGGRPPGQVEGLTRVSASLCYRGNAIAYKGDGRLFIHEGSNLQSRSVLAHLRRRAASMGIRTVTIEEGTTHHRMFDGPGRTMPKTLTEKGTLRFPEQLEEGSRFKHLAGCGKRPGRLAREIKAGDILSFEHSPESHEVSDVQSLSPRLISITVKDRSSGKTRVIRRRNDSLMAVTRPKA